MSLIMTPSDHAALVIAELWWESGGFEFESKKPRICFQIVRGFQASFGSGSCSGESATPSRVASTPKHHIVLVEA